MLRLNGNFSLLYFIVFSLHSPSLFAAEYGQPVRYVKDIEYRIKAVYKTSSHRYTLNAAKESEIKPVIDNVSELTTKASRLYGNLYALVSSSLRDMTEEAYGEVNNFDFDMGDFPRNLSLELIGNSDGTISFITGPFSLDFSFDAESDFILNLWKADIVVKTPTFYVASDYDFHTGNLSNTRLNNFDLSIDLDASTGLSSLFGVVGKPLVDDYIDRAADDLEQKLKVDLAKAINDLSSAQYKLLDVTEGLPSNDYLVMAGVDLGYEIKRFLSEAVSGERLKISLSREPKRYSSNISEGAYDAADKLYYSHRLSLELGDSLVVDLWDLPKFGSTPATACNWGVCFAPQSTVDLPNTNDGFFNLLVKDLTPPPPSQHVPSGNSCTWSSSPSYGNGMAGTTYYEYRPIGACTHSLKKVTTTQHNVSVVYQ